MKKLILPGLTAVMLCMASPQESLNAQTPIYRPNLLPTLRQWCTRVQYTFILPMMKTMLPKGWQASA